MNGRSAALLAIAAAAIALSACAPTAPSPTMPPAPSPTATSPRPTPSPTTTPVVRSCEGVLDDASIAAYAEAGWTLSDDFADRMVAQDHPLRVFADSGGLLCQWGAGDASEYYGATTLPAPELTAEQGRLASRGYTSEAYGDGVVFVAEISEGVREFNLFTGDTWMVALSPERIDEVRRNLAA